MAISNATVVRAQCDACPQVVYADAPAKPKGFSGHVQSIDNQGRETNAHWFACQAQHIGKAAQNALKGAAPAGATRAAVVDAPATHGYVKDEESYS